MKELKFKLEYEPADQRSSTAYPAVIVAAGNSARMKGHDKQFLQLLGIPVLARTLCVFENDPVITTIVVVARKDRTVDVSRLAEKYGISKLSCVVEGGDSREESVKNGLLALGETYQKAIIHDGARPLVTSALIHNVAEALSDFDSATCAVKLKDTVKEIGEDGVVLFTPDREKLVCLQTPQGVSIPHFLRAGESLDLAGFTDDTSVLEAVGLKTKIVEGDYKNIKVTTPEDIPLAQVYLSEEL